MQKKWKVTKQGISLTVEADYDGASIMIRKISSGGLFKLRLQGAEKRWLSAVLADQKDDQPEINLVGFFAVEDIMDINDVVLVCDDEQKADMGADGFYSVDQIISTLRVDGGYLVVYKKKATV